MDVSDRQFLFGYPLLSGTYCESLLHGPGSAWVTLTWKEKSVQKNSQNTNSRFHLLFASL